jgi:hypothetical protein
MQAIRDAVSVQHHNGLIISTMPAGVGRLPHEAEQNLDSNDGF